MLRKRSETFDQGRRQLRPVCASQMSVQANFCSLSPTGDLLLGERLAVGEEDRGEGDKRISALPQNQWVVDLAPRGGDQRFTEFITPVERGHWATKWGNAKRSTDGGGDGTWELTH